MKPARILSSIVIVSVLALAGCASEPSSNSSETPQPTESSASETAAGYPVTVDTKFGPITIDEKPERVVALGWGDAELALALGVQPVGASDWLAFGGEGVGPWSAGLYSEAPKILGTLEISYEEVAALEPDLILDVRSSGDQERYDRLSEITTTVGVPEGGDSYLTSSEDQVKMVSAALGDSDKGAAMLAEVDSAFAAAAEAHPDWAGKTVSAATRTSEGWGAYTNDARVDFLTNLGFTQNPGITALPADANGWSVSLSQEQLDVLDADLIVAFPIWIDVTEITDDATWKKIPAVADGRAITITDDLAQAYSLGTPAAQLFAIENLVPLIEDALK